MDVRREESISWQSDIFEATRVKNIILHHADELAVSVSMLLAAEASENYAYDKLESRLRHSDVTQFAEQRREN